MRSIPRGNIFAVLELDISADDLVSSLLGLSATEPVCILDSCGVGHLNSHYLVAGIRPIRSLEISNPDPKTTLDAIERLLAGDEGAIFTLSYDFGRKLQNVGSQHAESSEPDACVAVFDTLVVHDYDTGRTSIVGKTKGIDDAVRGTLDTVSPNLENHSRALSTATDFSQTDYLSAIDTIKERIRSGDTYQTNLTRGITARLPAELTPDTIFWRLRRDHPTPFSAFIKRKDSTVISASPERFFKTEGGRISASPIKGTRPRGTTLREDEMLRDELVRSEKDRAENTMIVDLLRNDLGRVCEFGSVEVEKLCEIEEHPTLFHLVSTISGKLRPDAKFSEILTALFPCGSITGAPKISTMRIIDEIERVPRGLSMGAIGYRIPESFGLGETIDLSVAIRTMVVEGQTATFNVGGGIVIDSDPEKEWEETVVKSRALLNALGMDL